MSEITLQLDGTNKAQFNDWLFVYGDNKRNNSYTYDKTRFYSLSFPVNKLNNCNQLSLDAIVTEPISIEKVNEDKDIYSYNDFEAKAVIKITWLEIKQGVKVTITHTSPLRFLQPVLELLHAIAQDWQETRRDIARYVQEQAARHGVLIDTSYFPADLDAPAPQPVADPAPTVDNDNTSRIKTTKAEIDLICNKREFRDWFEKQYPIYAKRYKDTPKGATFGINFTNFSFVYLSENGQYKYTFTVTEQEGHSKIREDFFDTMLNTFGVDTVGTESKATKDKAGAKPRKRKSKKATLPVRYEDAKKWVLAWEVIAPLIDNDPTLEIDYDELRPNLKARGLKFGNETIKKIIQWGKSEEVLTLLELDRKHNR